MVFTAKCGPHNVLTMLYQYQIVEIARENQVPVRTIDKDWVLGHFLNAVFLTEELKSRLVFKGGTCLRKCYFQDYRFSEDLDFTFADQKDRIHPDLIRAIMLKAEEISGIRFYLQSFQETQSGDVGQGYKIQIKYWGANHKPNQPPLPNPAERWHDKIELDFSYSEKLFLPVVSRPLIHNFPDNNLIGTKEIPCYALEEIVAEKLRTLIQRNRPRDCYDLWYLFKSKMEIDLNVAKELFYKKLQQKNISLSSPNVLITDEKIKIMVRHWNNSLLHQLPKGEIPSPSALMIELKDQIATLFH